MMRGRDFWQLKQRTRKKRLARGEGPYVGERWWNQYRNEGDPMPGAWSLTTIEGWP